MKRLVLLFTIPEFENVHLMKDVVLVPYYLKKRYNLEVEVIYSNKEKKNVIKNFRGIKLKELPYVVLKKYLKRIDNFKIFQNINFYKYLWQNSKKIDYLMLFHLEKDKLFLCVLYKLINKKGKIYLKMDTDAKGVIDKDKCSKISLKYLYGKLLYKNIDLFSIETLKAMEKIKEIGFFKNNISKKLCYLPNGFDEDYLKEKNIGVKSFEEKENIMITVGRLGTIQKNTEMLLKALENINLKGWKVYLIGPYTEEFKKYYEDYILKYPEKKEKVILVGNIENKVVLYDYYNRAKVFILTSRYESYGLVLVEALRFGDYIIMTDVDVSKDITNNEKIGKIIQSENILMLKEEIENIIFQKIDLKENYNKTLEYALNNYSWEKITRNKGLENIFMGE